MGRKKEVGGRRGGRAWGDGEFFLLGARLRAGREAERAGGVGRAVGRGPGSLLRGGPVGPRRREGQPGVPRELAPSSQLQGWRRGGERHSEFPAAFPAAARRSQDPGQRWLISRAGDGAQTQDWTRHKPRAPDKAEEEPAEEPHHMHTGSRTAHRSPRVARTLGFYRCQPSGGHPPEETGPLGVPRP